MKVGTKSVLFGAHCFFLHPFFVAAAWIKLFGWTWDPRIWVAFFVHDLGYWGKPNMDGPEGETHPEFGAKIMHVFDGWEWEYNIEMYPTIQRFVELRNAGWHVSGKSNNAVCYSRKIRSKKWHDFSLYHSRYYAKKNDSKVSKLCYADKLAFSLTPKWLYLPLVNATGEIKEYLKMAEHEGNNWTPVHNNQKEWHNQLSIYMIEWVTEHVDGSDDNWIEKRNHE